MIESYPKGFAGFKRFTEEMDKQPSIKDLPGAVAVSHLEGTIAYKDVSFAYEDGTKVLDHINLKIQPGETVAFVGQSGSGKRPCAICCLVFMKSVVVKLRLTVEISRK